MKRIFPMLFALAMILAGCVPVLAASEDRAYYPIAVEEDFNGETDAWRIRKSYQLSLSSDPANIPVGDFERGGLTFRLLDMTRKDDVGVDTKPWVESVTRPSDTDKMETILKNLEAEIDVTTEDGYSGTLRLDHTTVQVKADGYATRTRTLSATRNYPNLSDADVSLVPKTIEDGGHTLELEDVQWAEAYQTGAEGAELRYSATASYTGTASSRYATGYTVSADYSGEVAKTGCDVVTYTAIFGVAGEAPEKETPTEESDEGSSARNAEQEPTEEPSRTLNKRPLIIGGVVGALAGCGAFAYKKYRRR